jgi:intracellular sulfur oxidation DsrE/DsrF family protein
MDRRIIFKALFAAGAGAFAMRRASAQATRATKVVYHLADVEKVAFVLGNLRNHLAVAGGGDSIRLAVAVHGPALGVFHLGGTNVAVQQDMRDSVKAGVGFFACANTMAARNWTLADLLPGFVVAEQGAVVLLADLQAQGWAYLRP